MLHKGFSLIFSTFRVSLFKHIYFKKVNLRSKIKAEPKLKDWNYCDVFFFFLTDLFSVIRRPGSAASLVAEVHEVQKVY